MKTLIASTLVASLLLAAGSPTSAQAPTPAERVAALKANLAASEAILKPYEWIETVSVNVRGEEKSRQMDRCYHGADGKVQKVPVTTPSPESEPRRRGLRGRIAEAKKEELTGTMKEAVALIRQYLPPDPARLQAAKDAGRFSIAPQPNQRVRLTFADYLKPGDSLILDIDLASNRPLEAKVSSYLDSEKEPVTLDVRFGLLENSATYATRANLEAKASKLQVTVENSGYRRP